MVKRCLATLADVTTAQDALARAQATWTQANNAVKLAQEHLRTAERAKHKAEDVHTASSSQLGALEKGVADAKGLVTEATKRVQACSDKVLADTKTVSELVLVAHGFKTTAKEVNLAYLAANKAVVAHQNDATKAASSIKAVQLMTQFTEAKRVHKHAVAAVTKARTDLAACVERTAAARKETKGLTTAASVAQTDAQKYKPQVVADA
jgi:chromosome segregation ATPase